MTGEITKVLADVGIRDVERVEALLKGYSLDQKFIAYVDGSPRWLVRVSSADQLDRRKAEAGLQNRLRRCGVCCPEPVAVGLTGNDRSFSISSWIAGESADEALPRLPDDQQYAAGWAAGQMLAAIHSLAVTDPPSNWREGRIRKYRRRVEQAREKGLSFSRQKDIEYFVEQGLSLLDRSELCYQHDDFHPGNLILNNGVFAGVIDFNRFDRGDPVEEFYKVPWFTLDCSHLFARGQVKGWLASRPTPDFWQRYHLFVAMNLHGALVWIADTGRQRDIADWEARISKILGTHDFRDCSPPSWFTA